MATSEPNAGVTPQPLEDEGGERRQELEDAHEALLLAVLALEEEWLLDDRITFSLRHQA